jgi:iron uptake system component EfeO
VLARTIAAAFDALLKVVDGFRTAAGPSGFKLYPQVTATEKRTLAAAVKAVQEPLSKVASKVADA